MPKCLSCLKVRSLGSIKESGICHYYISQLEQQNGRGNGSYVPASVRKRSSSRTQHLATKYGLTQTDYALMVGEQDGRCAICKEKPAGENVLLHVDHDHDTGAVRGLLCSGCNTGIGKLGDSPMRLAAAAEYLWAHGKKEDV